MRRTLVRACPRHKRRAEQGRAGRGGTAPMLAARIGTRLGSKQVGRPEVVLSLPHKSGCWRPGGLTGNAWNDLAAMCRALRAAAGPRSGCSALSGPIGRADTVARRSAVPRSPAWFAAGSRGRPPCVPIKILPSRGTPRCLPHIPPEPPSQTVPTLRNLRDWAWRWRFLGFFSHWRIRLPPTRILAE